MTRQFEFTDEFVKENLRITPEEELAKALFDAVGKSAACKAWNNDWYSSDNEGLSYVRSNGFIDLIHVAKLILASGWWKLDD